MVNLKWIIIIITIVVTIVILLIKGDAETKIRTLVIFYGIMIAAYALYINMTAQNLQFQRVQIQNTDNYWKNLQQLFIENPVLDNLYKDIYHAGANISEDAAMQIIAQNIENILQDYAFPSKITQYHVQQEEWIARVYTWATSSKFKEFWKFNSYLYSRSTDKLVKQLWSLEETLAKKGIQIQNI